jgi:uncharacterized protein with HEPN domain
MSRDRSHADYLQDILDAIDKAEQFTKDMNYEAFARDDKTIFAVVRALEIIGEASKKVSDELKEQHASLPWREMAGMRDKLVHDYSGVNVEVVWKSVAEDLPPLKSQVQQILAQMD